MTYIIIRTLPRDVGKDCEPVIVHQSPTWGRKCQANIFTEKSTRRSEFSKRLTLCMPLVASCHRKALETENILFSKKNTSNEILQNIFVLKRLDLPPSNPSKRAPVEPSVLVGG